MAERVTVDPFGPEVAAYEITSFDGITRELLEEWQDYMATVPSPQTGKPLVPRSRALCATAIRMFFLWAAQRDKCDAKLALWFTKVKVAPLQPKPLKHDTMIRVRHYFLEKDGTAEYLRNRAMFFYVIGVGARVAEVLRVPRVGWESVTVVQKGGSTKLMTCPDHAADMVRAYLATRIDDDPALWVSHPGTTRAVLMTPAAVRGIWRSVAKRLEVTRWTTHALRHTAATAMLAAGEDPLTVATFLGHKDLSTLKVYAQIPESTRAKAIAAINHYLLKAG